MAIVRYCLVIVAVLALFLGFALFSLALFGGSVTQIADALCIIFAGIASAQIEEFI